VSPINLVPDVIPVLGGLDAILVPPGIVVAMRLMSPAVLNEHGRRAASLAKDAGRPIASAPRGSLFWALAAVAAAGVVR
jgi:uncharacterized membrane protein YkvA (DUF1232 family)